MQIDGSGVGCTVGIELDSILAPTECDPVATAGIYLGIVWPPFGSTKFSGVCLEVDTGEPAESPYRAASFQVVFLPVAVAVLPEDAVSIQLPVSVEVEIEVTAGQLVNGLQPCFVNLNHKGAHRPGETIVGKQGSVDVG
jgi:hypothetical protein